MRFAVAETTEVAMAPWPGAIAVQGMDVRTVTTDYISAQGGDIVAGHVLEEKPLTATALAVDNLY